MIKVYAGHVFYNLIWRIYIEWIQAYNIYLEKIYCLGKIVLEEKKLIIFKEESSFPNSYYLRINKVVTEAKCKYLFD